MITSKYFKEREFELCTPSCSLQDMKQTTMSKLDTAREIAGIPFVLNCAYRSSRWDKNKGRSGTGSHTTGNAVDIRCHSLENRYKIVSALFQAGFTRIGIANNFIHADDSEKHKQRVVWLY